MSTPTKGGKFTVYFVPPPTHDAQAAVSLEVAAESSNVAFMNLTRQMPLEAKSDDLYDDEVHENERGQLAQAKAFLSLLSTA